MRYQLSNLLDLTVSIRICLVFIAKSTDDIFTALHGMLTKSSDENSVCVSVKCMHCDKTEEKPFPVFIPRERSFSLVY